jgi:hypothetical protein
MPTNQQDWLLSHMYFFQRPFVAIQLYLMPPWPPLPLGSKAFSPQHSTYHQDCHPLLHAPWKLPVHIFRSLKDHRPSIFAEIIIVTLHAWPGWASLACGTIEATFEFPFKLLGFCRVCSMLRADIWVLGASWADVDSHPHKLKSELPGRRAHYHADYILVGFICGVRHHCDTIAYRLIFTGKVRPRYL